MTGQAWVPVADTAGHGLQCLGLAHVCKVLVFTNTLIGIEIR